MLTDNVEIECEDSAVRARKTLAFVLVALILIGFTSAMTWANACLVNLIVDRMQ